MLLRRNGESGGYADLSEAYPQLAGNGGFPFESFSWQRMKDAGVDVVFFATPHEFSRELVPEAMAQGFRVIDLSGAWRLKQADESQSLRLRREAGGRRRSTAPRFTACRSCTRTRSKRAALLANPGCYSTSIILALAPWIRAGYVDVEHGIICDSKSGVSGAGKTPSAKTHFVEVDGDFSAYSVFGHRHTGEVLEQLGIGSGSLQFTPHLLPIPRGILSTIYVKLAKPVTRGRTGAVAARVLRGQAVGAGFRRGAAAADQVFAEHELLRHRLLAFARRQASGAGFVPRQPAEGRGGTGGAEHEPDVRLRRKSRTAMKLVIKIGGAALDDKELVSSLPKTIPSLCREGHKLVIVHGGGAALSRTLKQLGCETTFVNGLRVTDSQTRDVAIMVLAGQLNKQLVAAIGEAGQPAHRHVRRRPAHGAGVEEEAARPRLRRRDLRRRCAVDRAVLGCRRCAGDFEPRAGLRRRVLQRQCRPDGVGLRRRLRRARAGLSHRCCGREGRRRHR